MTATTTGITTPGIYDIPAAEYLADPVEGGSLSASGARLLMPPNVPADYLYQLTHPRPVKVAYDFGHLAHRRVLGIGDEYEVVYKTTRDKQRVPADSFDTKSAEQHADEIRAAGKVPVLEGWLAVVEEMAAAIEAHPEARALLTSGPPERSGFWRDDQNGIWRRARFDVLPDPGPGRMILPDYKTARSADPAQFNRSIGDYGYAMQAGQYLDGVAALLGEFDAALVFVVQKNTAPYHVAVIEPDADWLRIGRERMDRAARIYAECKRTGHWPAYPGIRTVSPPVYVTYAHDDDMAATDLEIAS